MKEHSLEALVRAALAEDVGTEDITTNATVPADSRCGVALVAKQDGVLSGIQPFKLAFDLASAQIADWSARNDGDPFHYGDIIASFSARTRAALTAERTALNFIQHLSGVASLTAKFVASVNGVPCRICDTRKTTPMLRQLEKEAVVHGGGANHRRTLVDGVLIKDNHIVAAGGIVPAVRRAKAAAHHLVRIEVEVTNLDELEEAIAAGADAIMLDNMALDTMTQAVRRAEPLGIPLEASGNVTLERVRAIAETGVRYISVGALTHSAPAADFSLQITNG